MVEKQKQQEIAAGNFSLLWMYGILKIITDV